MTAVRHPLPHANCTDEPHGSGGGDSTVNSRMSASGRYTVFIRGNWDSALPLEKSIVSTPFSTC